MDDRRCWTLTTGEAGMASQAIGLAEAIGLPTVHKVARPRAPWRWLPGHLCPGVLLGLETGSDSLAPPWPDLLISCGRRSTPLAIAIRRHSRGRTLTVHIQDPRIDPSHFDLVVPMAHDGLEGDNVVPTLTALHRITPERLKEAAEHFAPRLLADWPGTGPRIAVLIGGSSRRHRLDEATSQALAARLIALQHDHRAHLMITASRRTGAANCAVIARAIAGSSACFWTGEGENPYLGMLALADFVLVTEDSVSMVSEACATGRPVYTIDLPGHLGKRLGAFHDRLRRAGMTRPFTGALETWSYTIPDETRRIAGIVRERLEDRPSPMD